jgi:osmoprotectant transport system substrate-binding protein
VPEHRVLARRRSIRSAIVWAAVVASIAPLAAACGSTAVRSAGTTTGTQTRTTTSVPLPGTGRPPLVIGDKNTPEQFVLGELYEEALASQGFSVSLNRNIGPTGVTMRALRQGSLDLYPEYIDVWNKQIAHDSRAFVSSHAAYAAGRRFAIGRGLELLNPTRFGNTEALAVTYYYASQHRLHTLRDLGGLDRPLTVGGPPQFKSSGLVALERAYGFSSRAFKVLPVGDQYQALNQGVVQAANVNTTDGDLASGDYRVLKDPSHIMGWGNVVPVVTQKTLQKEGPTFEATINAVSALLTVSAMRQMNEQVEQHVDPAAVAAQFLETHGLIPPGKGPS